jgi:hypothetical protein
MSLSSCHMNLIQYHHVERCHRASHCAAAHCTFV